MTPSPRALVLGLFAKPRTRGEPGIPKLARPSLQVDEQGVAGDHNHYRHRRKQGDPDMAVLLLAASALPAVQALGFPVAPGDLGENLLLAGVDHDDLRPGQVWRVGEVQLQIARECEPCSTLRKLPYVGPERLKEFLRALRGRRGWYARVLRGGEVRTGDEAVCEPGEGVAEGGQVRQGHGP